jgi:hypothetical protein
MFKFIILFLVFSNNAGAIDKVLLKTSALYGGAFHSLTYRGVEYIDKADHGRLLQSAVSFDGLGECYNPTEGGSWINAKTQASSKLFFSGGGYSLSAMGFWFNPHESCALNTVVTSNYRLGKKVVITGNLLTFNLTYYVPNAHKTATFEALTGYMPLARFRNSISFDPVTRKEAFLTAQGEQRFPVIHYSNDKLHAIGIYSPNLPQNYYGELVGYGRFSFTGEQVNKFNCVFREENILPNSVHSFTCKVIVGTLAEVRNGIASAYHQDQLVLTGVKP